MDIVGIFNAVKDSIGPIASAFLAMMIAIGGFLKAIEAVISLIAPLTPWKFDNDLADLLAKITTAKIFQKKEPK